MQNNRQVQTDSSVHGNVLFAMEIIINALDFFAVLMRQDRKVNVKCKWKKPAAAETVPPADETASDDSNSAPQANDN